MKIFYFLIVIIFLLSEFIINFASNNLDLVKKMQIYFPARSEYQEALNCLKRCLVINCDSITELVSIEQKKTLKDVVTKDIKLLENFLKTRCKKCSIPQLVAEEFPFSFPCRLPRNIRVSPQNFKGCPEKPFYFLPSAQVLFSILNVGFYSLQEAKTLEYEKLNSDQLLFKLLAMQGNRKDYRWQKDQPTIFQLVNRVIEASRAWPCT